MCSHVRDLLSNTLFPRWLSQLYLCWDCRCCDCGSLLWFQCDCSFLDWLTCIVQAHTCMHESSHIRAHMHTHFYREINKDNGKEWFFFLSISFLATEFVHRMQQVTCFNICDLRRKLKKLTVKHSCAKLQDYTKTLVTIVKVVKCTHNVLCVLQLKVYFHWSQCYTNIALVNFFC